MLLPVINLHSLADLSYLSATRSNDFSEAAAVCLDFHHQPTGVVLTMEGEWKERFSVSWNDVTQQMRDSRNDMDSTVESGAYCLAMLTLERCTGLKVIKQSQKRTGFDYWLGKEPNTGFQEMSRLEVSGILKGNTSQIHQRLKEKIAQTQKSDHLNIPAFIAIVEFSLPLIKVLKR